MGVYLGHDKVANGGFIGDYDSLPVGSILPYSSEKLPIGYLLCDGSEVSRSSYEELFGVIGTSFGEGNGSTTFNLPNLKGRVTVGKDSAQEEFVEIGQTGGEKEHQLSIGEMPSHNHNIGAYMGEWMSSGAQIQWVGSGQGYKAVDNPVQGDNQPHNNLQPYIVVNYIIKARGTAVLTGNVIDGLEENSTTNAPSQRAVNEKIGETKSKKEVLWSGSLSPTANNTYEYITIDKNVYDYDLLLVDVGSGEHLEGRTTVILTVEGKGVKCATRNDLFYLTESYRFTFGVETDGLNKIGFKVQNMTQYSLSDIKMYRVLGIKL